MTGLSHALASAVYALAALLGLRALWAGAQPPALVAWLIGAGVAVHGAAFVALHGAQPPVPLESFPAALSLIGLLVSVAYLVSLSLSRVRGVGLWVAGVAALFTALACLGLELRAGTAAERGGPWSHTHVLFSACGFSLLALTSLAGAAYLVKQGELKRKRDVRFALPSLESLDRMEHWTLSMGFALLTLGMASGFAWGSARGASPWTHHSAWLVAAWVVYLLPVGQRLLSHQHGERPARLVVGGFAFLSFSYLGIRLLGIES
jgi:ABC-type uncharacterized transport system permease subunit